MALSCLRVQFLYRRVYNVHGKTVLCISPNRYSEKRATRNKSVLFQFYSISFQAAALDRYDIEILGYEIPNPHLFATP